MRPFRRSARGLSEIVGTLMLVVIVVSAAVAFSLFLASYQKQLTAEQSFAQQRGLESLRVLSVDPILNNTNGGKTWLTVSFVLASEYVNPSVITSVALNGNELALVKAVPFANLSSTYLLTPGTSIPIPPRSQWTFTIFFDNASAEYSFFDPGFVLPSSSYLKVDVYTGYENDFSQTFVPPTAIALVSGLVSFNNGTPQTIPILDGSNSFQPVNGTLVAWNWTIQETSPTPRSATTLGEKATFPAPFGSPPVPGDYSITLVVTNSFGLLAATTITYVQP